MATSNLNTLLVNGNSVNGTRNWDTNMDYLNIDEAIASADGAAIIDNTNANTIQVASFLLTSVDSNFLSMNTLSWQIRRRVSGAQTNTRILGVRIVTESAGVVLAAANSGGTFSSVGTITNTTFSNGTVTAFAYVNTSATKAQWDDARIEFENNITKNHGGDSNGLEIDTVEITGTYEPVVSPIYGISGGTGIMPTTGQSKYESFSDASGQAIFGFNNYIKNFDASLFKVGSPVFDIKGEIWSVNGSGVPQSLLETSSNSFTAASLTTTNTGEWKRFQFAGNLYNQDIALVVRLFNFTTSGASDYVVIRNASPNVVSSQGFIWWQVSGSSWNTANIADTEMAYILVNLNVTVTGVLSGRGSLVGAILAEISLTSGTTSLGIYSNGGVIRIGQKIIGFKGSIYSLTIPLRKVGSPDHDLVAKIYSISGGIPNAVLQTSSNSFAVSTFVTQYIPKTFYFDGTQYNEDIAVVIEIENVTLSNSSNYVGLQVSNTDVVANQNYVDYVAFWSNTTSWDLNYVLKLNNSYTTATITGFNPNELLPNAINGVATVTGLMIKKGYIYGFIYSNPFVEDSASGAGMRNGTTTKRGNAWRGFSGRVYKASFWLTKIGSPDHDIKARIYDYTGGTVGSILETSINTVQATSLLITPRTEFDFIFSGTQYNQPILIALEIENFTVSDASNYIIVFTNTTYPGYVKEWSYTGSWFEGGDRAISGRIDTFIYTEGSLNKSFISGVINGAATVTGLLTWVKNPISGNTDEIAYTSALLNTANFNLSSTDPTNRGFGARLLSYNGTLAMARFLIKSSGNPGNLVGGELEARIYSVSGGIPNTILEYSKNIIDLDDYNQFPRDNTYRLFDFYFDGTTNYAQDLGVIVSYKSYPDYFNGSVGLSLDNITFPSGLDGYFINSSGTWSAQTASDASCEIYQRQPSTFATLIASPTLAGKVYEEYFESNTPSYNLVSGYSLITADYKRGISKTNFFQDRAIYYVSFLLRRSTTAVDAVVEAAIYDFDGNLLETSLNSYTTHEMNVGSWSHFFQFAFSGKSYSNSNLRIVVQYKTATVVNSTDNVQVGYETHTGHSNEIYTTGWAGSSTGAITNFQIISSVASLVTGTLTQKVAVNGATNPTYNYNWDGEGVGGAAAGWQLGIVSTQYTYYGISCMYAPGRVSELAAYFYKTGSPDYKIGAQIRKLDVNTKRGTGPILETAPEVYQATAIPTGSGNKEIRSFTFSTTVYDYPVYVYFYVYDVITGTTSDYVVVAGVNRYLPANYYEIVGWRQSTDTWQIGTIYVPLRLLSNALYDNNASWSILTAKGELSGTINGVATVQGVMATGEISATINNVATTAGILTAKGSLAGAINGTVTVTVSSITLKIDANINGLATLTGVLIADGILLGAINASATTTSVLTAKGDQDSTINSITTTSGVLSGKGALAGASNGVTTTSSDLTAGGSIGALSGEINGVATIAGILTATGALIGASNPALIVSGVLQARGDIDSTINGVTTLTATLIAKGDLDSSINNVATTSGVLTANGSLAGESNGVGSTTSVLTALGTLSGSSDGVATVQGALVSNAMFGTSNGLATTSGSLTAIGSLAGASNGVSTTSGALSSSGPLESSINGTTTITATLSAKGDFDSAINSISTVTGALTATGSLAGTINGATTTTSVLTLIGNLSGTINGVSTTSGVLTAQGSLIGVVNGVATTSSILTANGSLAGSSDGLATTSGTILTDGELLGQSNGLATTSGTLSALGALSGASNGVATVQGTLSANGTLEGASNGLTITTGVLSGNGTLSGTSNGLATTFGVIGALLVSQSDGVATVSGTLTANGQLVGTSNSVATTISVLTAKGDTDSTINAIATTSGTLSASGVLEGTINGIATTTSILSGNGNLTGTSNGVATTSGVLTSEGGLESPVNNVATVTGVLSGNGSLVGVINGVASTVGFMALDALESSINGLATVSGTLSGLGSLVGISNGITTITGATGSKNPIDSTVNGLATVTATLIGWGYMEGSSDPLPDELVWGTGNLFEAFEVDDESIGQTIAIQNKAVQWFEFEFDKIGSPDFEIRGEIWSLDGGGLPLTLLQVSTNTIQATSVTGTRDYYRWNFDITGINYDGDYALVAHIINHTLGNGTNYIRKYYDDNNPFTDGYELRNPIGVAWSAELNNDLNGRVRLKRGVSGNLSGTSFGISNGFATVSGTLTGSGALAGTSNGTSTASLGIFYMYASTNGVATVQGALTGIGSLAGTVSGLATTGGELITDALVGDGNGITTTQGTLTAKGALVGIINANSTATGTLTFEGLLLGVSDGTATVSATLTAKGALVGSSFGWSFAELSVTGFLVGTSEGFTYADGTLTAVGKLEGVINGSSEAVLEYIIPTILFGVSNGQATVTGTLTPTPPEDIDSSCFHLVRYIEKGPYLVNYRCNGKKQKFLYNIKCVK